MGKVMPPRPGLAARPPLGSKTQRWRLDCLQKRRPRKYRTGGMLYQLSMARSTASANRVKPILPRLVVHRSERFPPVQQLDRDRVNVSVRQTTVCMQPLNLKPTLQRKHPAALRCVFLNRPPLKVLFHTTGSRRTVAKKRCHELQVS